MRHHRSVVLPGIPGVAVHACCTFSRAADDRARQRMAVAKPSAEFQPFRCLIGRHLGTGSGHLLLSPHDTAVVTLPEEAPPEAGDNQLSLQELIMIFVAAAPTQSGGGESLAFCSPWRKVMHRAASHEAVPDRELSGRGCRPLCPSRPSQTGVNCLRCCSTPEEQLREGQSWHGVLDEAPFNRRVSASFSLLHRLRELPLPSTERVVLTLSRSETSLTG